MRELFVATTNRGKLKEYARILGELPVRLRSLDDLPTRPPEPPEDAETYAENATIEDAKTVAVFSLEMSKEALLQRMLCSVARVDSHKFRTGSLWQDDMRKIAQAVEKLSQAPMFIDDTPGITVSEMRAKSRRLLQSHGSLDMIVVDYLQLMSGGGKRYENRTQEVSAISRGLLAFSRICSASSKCVCASEYWPFA